MADKLFKVIGENWLLKLIALSFAVVLWFFVMGERRLEVGFTVPLELKQVPEGMMVASDVPSQVDVRLSGPRTLLMDLGPKDISISVDLSDLKAGTASFKRLDDKLSLPTGIRVTRLSPSYVDIKLERIRSQEVPIRVKLSGHPPVGLRVVGVETDRATVTIEGAEGELRALDGVDTDAVVLDNLKESRTLTVPINYRGRYSQVKGDQTVNVRISLAPVELSKKEKKKR